MLQPQAAELRFLQPVFRRIGRWPDALILAAIGPAFASEMPGLGALVSQFVRQRAAETVQIPMHEISQSLFKFGMVGTWFEKSRINPFAISHNDVLILLGGMVPKPDQLFYLIILAGFCITIDVPDNFKVGLGH